MVFESSGHLEADGWIYDMKINQGSTLSLKLLNKQLILTQSKHVPFMFRVLFS